ncbi:hypothetical protein ACP4OV_020317 [Aristida adscensionis]
MRKKMFVLYPSLGVGHLNPMVELAKNLLRHGHAVTIAVIDPPDADGMSAGAVARLAASNPAIAFSLLPSPASRDPAAHPVKRSLNTLRLANPVLREFLPSQPAVDALVLDMFLPAYFFFPSGASVLAVFLNLPYIYPTVPSFREMGKAPLHFPGVPPIRAMDMVFPTMDKDSEPIKVRLYQFKRIPEGTGCCC